MTFHWIRALNTEYLGELGRHGRKERQEAVSPLFIEAVVLVEEVVEKVGKLSEFMRFIISFMIILYSQSHIRKWTRRW